jgi:hypothetical protein
MSLGDAVAFNLKDRGLRMEGAAFDSAWDSIKKPRSERWVVTFTFTHRSREQAARWEYDPENDALTAVDKTSADLGWVAPIRRRSSA